MNSFPTSQQIGQTLHGLAKIVAVVAVAAYVAGLTVHAWVRLAADNPAAAAIALLPLKPVRPIPAEWSAVLLTDEELEREIAQYDGRTLKRIRPARPAKARRVAAPV